MKNISATKRSGMTILEVMFAIMITAIGLLGAIAVFPVASEYARKGRLNDTVAVASETIAHRFDAAGMRRPDRWITYVDNSANNQPAVAYSGSALQASSTTFWKTAFCIDPRFTAANATAHANNEQRWTYFPAFPQASANSPRMQRITLGSTGPGSAAMSRFQADFTFAIEDDLVYERLKVGTTPPNVYPPDVAGYYSPIHNPLDPTKPLPGKREEEGKLSWMATLCPKVDKNGAATPDLYTLSIVVFHRRFPSLVTRDFNLPDPTVFPENRWPDNEWVVSIAGSDFYSEGFGGGEVRLNADYAEKLDVKTGSWVMLAGNANSPEDSSGNPVAPFSAPVFKWYQVSEADDLDIATINGASRSVRNVTLIGADWDRYDADKDGNWDDTEVFIMPGIVSVYERTVRLEMDGSGY